MSVWGNAIKNILWEKNSREQPKSKYPQRRVEKIFLPSKENKIGYAWPDEINGCFRLGLSGVDQKTKIIRIMVYRPGHGYIGFFDAP